jgi:hypothetical protein
VIMYLHFHLYFAILWLNYEYILVYERLQLSPLPKLSLFYTLTWYTTYVFVSNIIPWRIDKLQLHPLSFTLLLTWITTEFKCNYTTLSSTLLLYEWRNTLFCRYITLTGSVNNHLLFPISNLFYRIFFIKSIPFIFNEFTVPFPPLSTLYTTKITTSSIASYAWWCILYNWVKSRMALA